MLFSRVVPNVNKRFRIGFVEEVTARLAHSNQVQPRQEATNIRNSGLFPRQVFSSLKREIPQDEEYTSPKVRGMGDAAIRQKLRTNVSRYCAQRRHFEEGG
jgi:hypothetical protein